jgi:hypothetical protein
MGTMANISAEDLAVFATALLVGSELLSLSPRIRANGWVQLFFTVLRALASNKVRR